MTSLKTRRVSLYKNSFGTKPIDTPTVADIFAWIRDGRYRPAVDRVRSAPDKDSRDELKRKAVPACTMSGRFTRRANDQLIGHSGVLRLDFDGVKNIEEERRRLERHPNALAVFKSVSGGGLSVLVHFDPIPENDEQHKQAFEKAQSLFRLPSFDEGVKDVSRLMYLTEDPDIYVNWNAHPIRMEYAREGPRIHTNGQAGASQKVIREGKRNVYLTSLGGAFRKNGLEIDEYGPALLEVNRRKCDPPLDEKEVERIAKSIAKYSAGASVKGTVPDYYTAPELLSMDLPAPTYVVDGVLPEGTSLLAGAPKVGKSLLALNIALAVSAGGRALGSVPVDQAGVLYLVLEGSRRGLKRRIETMLEGEPAPEAFKLAFRWPESADGGLTWLDNYIGDLGIRLIVIDTLKAFRGKVSGRQNIYDSDYEAVQPIAQLAEEKGVSVLLVHHTNKRKEGDVVDRVSGSTGLTGGVDNVLVLEKERGQVDAILTVTPREEEEAELALNFDPVSATWILQGNADEIAKTLEQQRVLDVLRDADGPMRAKEIAGIADLRANNVSKLLYKLRHEGLVIQPKYGHYEINPLRRL